MIDTDRCPDCGHAVAFHFHPSGRYQGCPANIEALRWHLSAPRVSVRVWRRGEHRGQPIAILGDVIDGEGVALALNLTTGKWESVSPGRSQELGRMTRRADLDTVARVKEDVERVLGQRVRIVKSVHPKRGGGT